MRRWVPELTGLAGSAVHEPWKQPRIEREKYAYPDPILELAEGLERFRRARGRDWLLSTRGPCQGPRLGGRGKNLLVRAAYAAYPGRSAMCRSRSGFPLPLSSR